MTVVVCTGFVLFLIVFVGLRVLTFAVVLRREVLRVVSVFDFFGVWFEAVFGFVVEGFLGVVGFLVVVGLGLLVEVLDLFEDPKSPLLLPRPCPKQIFEPINKIADKNANLRTSDFFNIINLKHFKER